MMNKNILHLRTTNGFGGGADQVIFNLIRNLPLDSFRCSICFLRSTGLQSFPISQEAKKLNIDVFELIVKGRFHIAAIKELRNLLISQNINILHTHGYKADIYGYLAANPLNIPVIATAHGWIGNNLKDKFYIWMDLFFMKKMNMVTAVSKPIFQKLLDYGLKKDRVKYIPNAVDDDFFSPSIRDNTVRQQLHIPMDSILVGCIGRLSREKGQIYLFMAAKEILKEFQNIHFLIVGEGPDKKKLEDFVISNNLQDKIHLIPFQTNIKSVYSALDLVVVPSFTEGLPLVVLEAMAMNVPVISTNVGGVKEIIEHNSTGLLISPGDSDALKSNIVKFIKNEKDFSGMARSAGDNVKNIFSIHKAVRELVACYENLLDSL